MKNQSLLSRLRRAVQKVRLLLSSAVLSRTWQVASVLRRASGLSGRHLSFNNRSPTGLIICSNEDSASSPAGGLVRTTSSSSSEDDIDKRAEMFINNFRRQLRMERQISLQLRHCRTDSFEISPWFAYYWFCVLICYSWGFLPRGLTLIDGALCIFCIYGDQGSLRYYDQVGMKTGEMVIFSSRKALDWSEIAKFLFFVLLFLLVGCDQGKHFVFIHV